MRRRSRPQMSWIVIILALAGSVARGGPISDAVSPSALTLQPQGPPESIYAPPRPAREDEGVNEGAVHIDLTVRYMTDYVYRGLDFSEVGGSEDSPNLQFDGKLSFDLGKLPHPFVALFVNVYDSDPVSRFQEVRPVLGTDWTIKPIILTAGHITYIYPDRDEQNTSEIFGRIMLDDGFFWSTERPIFSPYVYAAYDYDLYNGWYFEAGIKHDFVFEESGIVVTVLGDVAYVMGSQLFSETGSTDDTGFQHYDIGMIASYSLNRLLNIPRRYGEFGIEGYLYYTDGIDSGLEAETQLWGGAGITFKY